ncbi:MAG: GntR family transcriptional regulator [Rhodobacterales bacterium]|nr:GntR family transcriptional regulator [Rhodobacterales bacterium]
MEKRLADRIADEIEEMIFDHSLADGARLDEHALAERFSVSRTPIREALQKLALSGLVTQIPNRGVFVHQPGAVELIEMFEVMAELEAAAGRLAALRITDEALGDLQRANTRCQQAVAAEDTDAYYVENEYFHHLIYTQSGNSFLQAEALRLHRRLRPFRRQQLRLRGRMAQSMAEHESIVAALVRGDAPAAADLLRAHVAVQGEKFHHLMASLRPTHE